MFDGFTETGVGVGVDVGDGVRLRVRVGGSGPVVVLLHGHPRTHTTWHRVAPLLAARGLTVVCPDLRGYGQSSKPVTTADHSPYSKRAMAGDVVRLMRRLGHDRFAVVGHDRGSYVAARLALDAPEVVTRLAVLDSVPIGEALARADARFATAWYHWFFFAQPVLPERLIAADPAAFYKGDPAVMGEENFADFQRAIHNPATVSAMLEDYRAGPGSTEPPMTPTARPAGGSPARPWCCGPPATTWNPCTATSSRSGNPGRPTCAGPRSTADTTWPKRPPGHSRISSPRS